MADTPAQAALREAFNSKLSVIPQTLSQEKQTQAQTNIGGPFLPLSGGTVSGTIAATGFSGPLAGNASTASKWATARTITLSGDATGSVSFDGSADATLTLTIANGSVTNAMLAASSVTFSKVASGDVATQAEAEAGTANNSFMTPLRVAQAIAAQALTLESHITSRVRSQLTINKQNAYRTVTTYSDGFVVENWHLYIPYSTETVITLAKPCAFTDYFVGTTDTLGGENGGRCYIKTSTTAAVNTYYTGNLRGNCWCTCTMAYQS